MLIARVLMYRLRGHDDCYSLDYIGNGHQDILDISFSQVNKKSAHLLQF